MWIGCRQSVTEWIANIAEFIVAKGHGPAVRACKIGNIYIFVVMDYLSKWPEVYPIPNQETDVSIELHLTKV